MNYPVKTDSIYVSRIVFDETSEQTVDADFGLPDYCPDIQKILKCRIEPHIDSKNIIGDRIEIEGTAVVRIIYVDAIKMSVRCTEQSYPYSISCNLREAPDNAVIQTDLKVSYLNCRALSPRRLNIHGAFNVGIKVIDRSEVRTVNHIKGDDIQQKKKTLDYSYLQGVAQQQFSVTETLETGQSHPAVQAVVRSDVRAVKGECTPVSNKLMYKGELLVKLMYLSDLDSGKTETMEYSIPFSQVIDLTGIGEESICAVRTEVMSSNITLRSEIGFDDPLPVLSAKLCVTAFSFEKRDTIVITDCYSTKYATQPEFGEVALPSLLDTVKESVVEKTNVDLTDSSVARVIDVWCETGSTVCTNKDGRFTLCGKYNICVLAADTSDNIMYTERSADFSHSLNINTDCDKVTAYLASECVSAGFRICSDKRIEVRAELLVTGEVYSKSVCRAVTSLSGDDSAPRQGSRNAVVLYFADKNESIWDIARCYCTSAEKICRDNDLDEEILTFPKMLMITE